MNRVYFIATYWYYKANGVLHGTISLWRLLDRGQWLAMSAAIGFLRSTQDHSRRLLKPYSHQLSFVPQSPGCFTSGVRSRV